MTQTRTVALDPARPTFPDTPDSGEDVLASDVAIQVVVPTTEMQAFANRLLTERRLIAGGFDSPPVITRSGYAGDVTRGLITVRSGAGGLSASVRIVATITAGAHVDPGPGGGVRVSVAASTASAVATVSLVPRLMPSYTLGGALTVTPEIGPFHIGHIELHDSPNWFINRFRRPIGDALRRVADREISGLIVDRQDEMWRQINEQIQLRRRAGELWAAAHVVQQIGSDPKAWVVIQPLCLRAAVGPITPEQIALRIGVRANARVVVQDAQPAVEPVAFPDLLTVDDSLSPSYDVNVPVQVVLARLNDPLATALTAEVAKVTEGRVSIGGVEVGTAGRRIVVKVKLSAEVPHTHLRIGGVLYLCATPRFDVATQSLVLADLAIDAESGRVLKAASPWLERTLLSRIQAVGHERTFQVELLLGDVRREAAKQSTWASGGGGPDIRASQTMGDLKFLGIRVANGQAIATFCVIGTTDVNVLKLR